MSLAKRLRRARFENHATLEGFDFGAAPKLPAAQIRDLAALRWLHAGESVILYGPVGVGKSHVAQALAHLAVRAGAEARFAKTSRVLAHLAGGARRPHLGQTAPRAHPPRRPDPGPIRGPQPPVRNVASVGQDDCFLTSACRYPRSHANVGDVGMMSGHGGAACPA